MSMEEVEIEVNGKKVKVVTELPKEFIEDNNLNMFTEDTIDLEDVIEKVKDND